jgi:hypothetical protein
MSDRAQPACATLSRPTPITSAISPGSGTGPWTTAQPVMIAAGGRTRRLDMP